MGVTLPHQQAIEPAKPGLLGLGSLWRGEQPLWRAFWLYWVLGAWGVFAAAFVFYLLVAMVLEKIELSGGIAGLVFFPFVAAILYHLFAAVGTWRSASWAGLGHFRKADHLLTHWFYS